MSLHTESHTIAVTGGVGSATTNHKQRGMVHQILITPPNPDPDTGTTWSMEVREEDTGVEILGWDDFKGARNSTFGLELPMWNKKYTLNIVASDADGNFTFRFTVKEPVY